MEMKLSEQIRLILTDGKHTGTHKFALLRAILDYIVESNPGDDKDLDIPLFYLAEKFLTYYWVMYVNKIDQLISKNTFLYYDYLDTILQELNIPGIKKESCSEKHVHDVWDAIRKKDSYSPDMLTALNRTRIIIYNNPVKHAQEVSRGPEPMTLDFYSYTDGNPGRINAKTYKDFYRDENIFITIKKKYINEFKEMYFWYETAIITFWAEFTDKHFLRKDMPGFTGLSLLRIPGPERESLNNFKKHFKDLGINKCVYCYKKPFEAIDHVVPWKMVKSDQFWNMLPICTSCNSSKSDRIWSLSEEAKQVLTDSIHRIVLNLDDYPKYKDQVITHFNRIRKDLPVNDKEVLCRTLYEETITRITDFVKER